MEGAVRIAASAVIAFIAALGLVIAFPGIVPGTMRVTTVQVPVVVTQTLRVNVTHTAFQTVLKDTAGPVWELVFVELPREPREGSITVYNATLGLGRSGIAAAIVVKAPDGYQFAPTVNGFVFRLETNLPVKALVLYSDVSVPVVPGLDRSNYRTMLAEKAFSPTALLPYQNPRRADASPGAFTLQRERGNFQPYSWLAIWPLSVYFHGIEGHETKVRVVLTYSLVEAR
ncbi:MAG: hypothetical protein NYU90_05790 [Aigarchaeota archaeon]|nr:hypothetical protein [Candidatus Calditenuis fumarioli]